MIAIRPLADAAAASTTWHYSCILGSEIVRPLDVFDGDDLESLLYRAGFSMEMVEGSGSNPHRLSASTPQGAASDGDDASPRCEECHGQ